MSFKQKLFLDKTKLKVQLEKLLKHPIDTIEINYQSEGSTGEVNRVTLCMGDNRSEYILKKIENFEYYIFYRDIIQKEDLNHPKIYGWLMVDEDKFLLMKYICDSKKDWNNDDYLTAIKWLAKKDAICCRKIFEFRKYDYIEKKKGYLAELKNERVKVLNKAEIEYPNLFTISATKLLELSEELFSLLNSEPLTLVHNDFCKNNILLSSDNQIHVIDWTGPFIGSIGIDLSEIANDSPIDMQDEMISLYKKITGFEIVDQVIKKIQLNSQIGHIVWRMKRLFRGDDIFQEIEEELKEVMRKITESI